MVLHPVIIWIGRKGDSTADANVELSNIAITFGTQRVLDGMQDAAEEGQEVTQ
ncbi:MAG: hypothetical protein IPL98_08155 [Saprospiraceae bacterium]|nr:hypothetical protein [Saprospiraceae bacterium]